MKNKKSMFHPILLLIGLLLVLIGVSTIMISMNQKNILPPPNYSFRLKVIPKNLMIQRFKFEYDFTEKTGRIKFETSGEKIERLHLHFPVGVNKKNLKLDVYENDGKNQLRNLEIDYNNDCKKNSYCIKEKGKLLRIDGLDIGNMDYTFIISHDLRLEPLASFDLETHNNDIAEDDFAFDLFLGNDYRCIYPIYEDLGNSTKQMQSSSCPHFKIKFQSGTEKKPQHKFKIFAESLREEKLKDILLSIGVVSLSAGISLIIESYLANQNLKNQEKIRESIKRHIKYYTGKKRSTKKEHKSWK